MIKHWAANPPAVYFGEFEVSQIWRWGWSFSGLGFHLGAGRISSALVFTTFNFGTNISGIFRAGNDRGRVPIADFATALNPGRGKPRQRPNNWKPFSRSATGWQAQLPGLSRKVPQVYVKGSQLPIFGNHRWVILT